MSRGSVIAAIVIAAVLLLAVVALLAFFARRHRSTRQAASRTGHPSGTAPVAVAPAPKADAPKADAPNPAVASPALAASTPTPTPTPTRFRRREGIAPIREAEAGDLARLADLDTQSEQGLAGSGLGALPGPGPLEHADGGYTGESTDAATATVVLVSGRPAVAYLRLDEVDGLAHVDRLAVLPAVARRGIGKALLDAAVDWARAHGYPAMTLSTFLDSEWNAQVYEPSGFAAVDALTPGLVELRDWERAVGLDAMGTRVVMRRDLSA